MERLSMCRICSVKNVRMYVLVNKNLHELYEKLTDIPFVTDDRRPVMACFVCCSQLKKFYRLLNKCLKAEELFAQILNEEYEQKPLIKQDNLDFLHGFIKTPIQSINIVEVQTESVVVKQELPDVCEEPNDILVPKEEYPSDDDLQNNCLDCLEIVYMPPNQPESQSENDVALIEVKIEVEEEEEEEYEQKPKKTKSAPDEGKPRIKGTITAKQENIELPDSIMIKKTEKPLNEIKSRVHNNINSTAVDTGCTSKSNKHLIYNKCTNEGIGDINKEVKLSVEENPFKCNICQKFYKSNYLLNRHMQQHNEKHFKCDICNRSFHRNSHLINHVRIHTGEKPFTCEICDRSFKQKTGLTTHLRTHSSEKPFKCDICHSSFRQRGNLTMHMRVHSGEKPFKCDICNSSFHQNSHLVQHVRIHTGEKPYRCDICQRTFRHTSSLSKHVRTHSVETPQI